MAIQLYRVQIHPRVDTEDLPTLPAQLKADFSRYKLILAKQPQNPLRVPSHNLTGRLAGYCALEIEWEGNPNAYRLVYRVCEKPAPRRVLVLSFDEHAPAYEKAISRASRKR